MQEKPRDWHGRFERDLSYGNSRSGAVTTGVASLQVLDANARRKQVIFVNNSVAVIYLTKGPTAAINTGIRLNAGGGSWIETPDTLGYFWRGAFSAIASAAGAVLTFCEDM